MRDQVMIRYRNHKGIVADRRIVPKLLWFGEVEWHPGPQWLLEAKDLDKGAMRTFAMKDILEWKPLPPVVAEESPQ